MNDWWNSRDKETAAYGMAGMILVAWLVLIFLKRDEAPTLTNVVMIIIGYIYGSSTGSKRKDDDTNKTLQTLALNAAPGGAAVAAAATAAAPAAAEAAAPAAATVAAPPAAAVAAPPAAEAAVEHALAERGALHDPTLPTA
jgi:hypothetical protein